MKRNLIVILGITILIILLCGCIEQHYIKKGVIREIETYPFGGTFSDHMCVLIYDDNSELHLTNYYNIKDRFILNESSEVVYTKFEYDGIEYNRFERFKLELQPKFKRS